MVIVRSGSGLRVRGGRGVEAESRGGGGGGGGGGVGGRGGGGVLFNGAWVAEEPQGKNFAIKIK